MNGKIDDSPMECGKCKHLLYVDNKYSCAVSKYTDAEVVEKVLEFAEEWKDCTGTIYSYRDLLRACGFIDKLGDLVIENE